LAFDWPGFREAMVEHGDKSRTGGQIVMGDRGPIDAVKKAMHSCEFLGYETTTADAELKFIVAQDHLVDHLDEVGHNKEVIVILDRTPFYGESGGQVGDTGEIVGKSFRFVVTNTQKDGQLFTHIGHLEKGEMRTGEKVTARVDTARRSGIRRAHSATHILHHALQKTLGTHAQQQGSKVDDDWLRFDFTNMSPVSSEQLQAIEKIIGERVAAAAPVTAKTLPLADARKLGAMMLFGEKYPDPVRMISMGEFSRELCGGTHLDNTSEVEALDIISEESVAAGTRRIVALTGAKAKQNIEATRLAVEQLAATLGVPEASIVDSVKGEVARNRELKKCLSSGGKPKPGETIVLKGKAGELTHAQRKSLLHDAARLLNVPAFDAPARMATMLEESQKMERELSQRKAAGPVSADELLAQAKTIASTTVLVAEIPGGNANLLRKLIDQIRKKLASSAVLLAAREGEGKVTLVAGLSSDLVERGLSAGKWVQHTATFVDGGGGGRADMAQAGGKNPDKLPAAFDAARAKLSDMLKS
jgi:alanyl-tRNA synthetase